MKHAMLFLALGLLLVRRGATAEALVELERAASSAPGETRYAYVLGVALHQVAPSALAVTPFSRACTRRRNAVQPVQAAAALLPAVWPVR